MHGHAFDDQDRWHDYSPTAPTRQRPYYSTPCPAGDVQSVRIVESPCTPHWTPNYWRPGPVIRPPARWTMLVEELPKSMLRQSPNQQIPFYPTPGLNALFKGLLLTDAKRHMCHVLCSHCTNKWCWNQCNLFHRNSCSSGLKTAGFQWKQFDVEKRVQKQNYLQKQLWHTIGQVTFFWKHCNVQKEFEFRATLVTIHMICKNTIFKKQLTIEVNWFLRRRKLRFSRQIRFLSSTVNNLIYKNRWGRLLRTVGLRWELEELDKLQINPNP